MNATVNDYVTFYLTEAGMRRFKLEIGTGDLFERETSIGWDYINVETRDEGVIYKIIAHFGDEVREVSRSWK